MPHDAVRFLPFATQPQGGQPRHRAAHVELAIPRMATSPATALNSDKTLGNPRPLIRLLRYALPYWGPSLASVVLMALVGLLDAGRVLLIGPIFDSVLNPGSHERTIPLFKLPGSER